MLKLNQINGIDNIILRKLLEQLAPKLKRNQL